MAAGYTDDHEASGGDTTAAHTAHSGNLVDDILNGAYADNEGTP